MDQYHVEVIDGIVTECQKSRGGFDNNESDNWSGIMKVEKYFDPKGRKKKKEKRDLPNIKAEVPRGVEILRGRDWCNRKATTSRSQPQRKTFSVIPPIVAICCAILVDVPSIVACRFDALELTSARRPRATYISFCICSICS